MGHLSGLLFTLGLLQRRQQIWNGPSSYCFFADPDLVSLEDADLDLNLALPSKIIWGKISTTFRKDLFFFCSPPEFWQKYATILSEDRFFLNFLVFN